MASNFGIFVHRNSDSLHLKLMGDFDGSSALELLDEMKKINNRVQKIFIHTSCLKSIHPLGRDTFRENLAMLNLQPVQVFFTGESAGDISPNRIMCL